MDEHGLMEAADKVQKFVLQVTQNPGDGLGIIAMLMTNFLASGVATGLCGADVVDIVLDSIRQNVNDTVAAIYEGMAADAATETIQ